MGGERRTVLIALASNVIIAVSKAIGGLATGSSAMLAETAHSLADSFDQLLMLLSLRLGRREPDEEHPFGYGQERFFWTFVVAVVIFLAGATFSVGDGVLRLLGYHPFSFNVIPGVGPESYWIDYVILAIALGAEGTSLARAYRQTRQAADEAGYGFLTWVRISKDPTTKMVFAEDAVAVTGVVVAFLGVALHEITGSDKPDAASAILIGLLLISAAVMLGINIRDLLLGRAAREDQRETMHDVISGHDGVDELVELLTMVTGPGSILVAARIDLEPGLGSDRVEELCDEIDEALREAVPEIHNVFLDATPGSSATDSGSPRRRGAPSPPGARGSRRRRSTPTRSGR